MLRSSANDPQIQMAEDAADAISSGHAFENVLPKVRVDISKSLAPYLIIYDNQGHIFSSSATLHGKVPQLPDGVFSETQKRGELRFTWEPLQGVRQAVVLIAYPGVNSGYVLAGRSLREVENRMDDLGIAILAGWITSFIVSFIVVWISVYFLSKEKKKRKR